LKDSIPKKEKVLRQKLILETQKKNAEELNSSSLGKIYRVLIDRKENNYFIGRTYKDAPEVDQEVFVNSDRKLSIGEFCNAEIYDFEEFDLFGEVTK
jgi:ribosomal protein S12 methylthiotransferase